MRLVELLNEAAGDTSTRIAVMLTKCTIKDSLIKKDELETLKIEKGKDFFEIYKTKTVGAEMFSLFRTKDEKQVFELLEKYGKKKWKKADAKKILAHKRAQSIIGGKKFRVVEDLLFEMVQFSLLRKRWIDQAKLKKAKKLSALIDMKSFELTTDLVNKN